MHRSEPEVVDLTPFEVLGEPSINLVVKLVRSSNTRQASYDGFYLVIAGQPVLRHRWQDGKALVVPPESKFEVSLRHVVGFPSNDTKQSLLVAGQGTATNQCCCLVCVEDKNNFTKHIPKWQQEMEENAMTSDHTPAPLREGEYANEALYETWRKRTHDETIKPNKEDRLACGSTQKPPLLRTPIHKEPMAPMHSPQGIFTHFCAEIRSQLRTIESNSRWAQQVQQAHESVKKRVEEKYPGYAEARKNSGRFRAAQRRFERQLAKEKGADTPNEQKIQDLEQKVDQAREMVRIHASEMTNYGKENRIQEGIGRLLSSLDSYLEDKSKKPQGIGEFIFNKGIEMIGQVAFRPEHSGFELSHADGMKVLEKWSDIADCVAKCYDNSDEAEEFSPSIKSLMERSKEIAQHLLVVSKILKSQSKQSSLQIIKLRDAIYRLSKAWRNHFPNTTIFLKFHHVEAHVLDFVKRYEMYGRVSEEGFESAHPYVNQIRDMLKSVASTTQRINTICQRLHSGMNDEVTSAKTEVKVATTGKKRSRYDTSNSTSRAHEHVGIVSDFFNLVEGGAFLQLAGEVLIPAEWKDVYFMAVFGKVPDWWTSCFQDRNDLGAAAKEKVKFSTKE